MTLPGSAFDLQLTTLLCKRFFQSIRLLLNSRRFRPPLKNNIFQNFTFMLKKYLNKKARIKNLSLEQIEKLSHHLSKIVKSQDIDLIIGLKTGGYIPSIHVSQKLAKPVRFINLGRQSKIFGINIEKSFYLKNLHIHTSRKNQKIIIRDWDSKIEVKEKKVLLVDDDSLTGKTMITAKQHLMGLGAGRITTACLISYNDCYQPDFSGYKTKRSKLFFIKISRYKFPWSPTSIYFRQYKDKLRDYRKNFE